MTAPLSAPGTPAPARKSLSAPSSPASCEIEIVAVPAPARKSLSAPSSPASCEIEIGAIQGPHSAPPRFASLFLPAAVAFPSASSIASSYFMLKFETPKYYCTVIDASTTGGFEAISEADCVVFIIDSTTGGFDAGISKDGQTLEDYLLAPLGLMQLICCRNKMDATTPKYSKANDDDVVKEVSSFLKKVGYSPDNFHFVPISGFEGAEVAMKDLKRRSVSPPTSLSGISSGPTSSSKSHFKPIPQSFLSFDYRRDSAKPWLTQHGNQEAKYSTLSSGKPLPHIERWKNVRPQTTKKSFHLKTRAEDKQSPDSVSRHRSSAREDSLKKVQMRRSLVERMSALDEE